MNKKIKWSVAILMCAAILITIGLAGCKTESAETTAAADTTDAEKIMIGVSVEDQANTFWAAWLEPIIEFCEENDIELMISDGQGKVEKQVEAIENWTSMGVDGIVVSPLDPAAISTVTNVAMDKGIKVFAAFYKIENYDAHNTASQYDMGFLQGTGAGEWINENLASENEVQVVTTNMDTIPEMIPRREGAEEGVLAMASNAKIVGTAFGIDAAKGMDVAEDFLQAHPDLRVFLGSNDGVALGALEAFRAAGKTDPNEYLIGGVDASDDALKQVWDKDSIFQVTVNQDPRVFGRSTIETLYKAIMGEPFEKDTNVPVNVVTRDNISDYVDSDGNLIIR